MELNGKDVPHMIGDRKIGPYNPAEPRIDAPQPALNWKRLWLIAALAVCLALAYFIYWQGFYRGADVASCAMAIAIHEQDPEISDNEFWDSPRARACIRMEEQWLFFKDDT